MNPNSRTQHSFPSPSLTWRQSILATNEAKSNVGMFSVTPTCYHHTTNPHMWLHSSSRISCFMTWKQLSGACTCLQGTSWSSQELLPPRSLTPCINLWHIFRKEKFCWKIVGSNWNGVSLVVGIHSLSSSIVMQDLCVDISPWTTSSP
jgi:hypothetical protein